MSHTFNTMNAFYHSENEARKTCPVCGKAFAPAPEHAYYIKNNRSILVCSYTCMRKWDKGEVKELKTMKIKAKRYKTIRIVETGETFNSPKECANYLNAGFSSVYKALYEGVTCHGVHIEAVEEGETE